MTKKYYLVNFLWGALLFVAIVYYWATRPYNQYTNVSLTFGFVSMLLYPFSKLTIERIALKFTPREFWRRGFFRETVGKNGLYVLYYAFCFLASIPLGVAGVIITIKENNAA